MPKPGYYYFENKRAIKGIVLLSIFLFLAYLAKKSPPSDDEVREFLVLYRIEIALGVILFAVILYLFRRILVWLGEPRPNNYHSRQDFLVALEKYGARKRYKPGWVYYRSKELWPDPFD